MLHLLTMQRSALLCGVLCCRLNTVKLTSARHTLAATSFYYRCKLNVTTAYAVKYSTQPY